MKKIQVKESDLIGELEGFPIEVVEKMLERQFEQTGKFDVKVFQDDSTISAEDGGFTWGITVERRDFWSGVIECKYFNLFFEKYPKHKIDFTQADLHLIRKWFNVVQVMGEQQLGKKDYVLARDIYIKLELDVPEDILDNCE